MKLVASSDTNQGDLSIPSVLFSCALHSRSTGKTQSWLQLGSSDRYFKLNFYLFFKIESAAVKDE